MADPITFVLIGLYFVVLIGIGSWASKKIHTTEDYILAGRSLGFWVFTILIICSVCSGMTLLGVSGFGYTSGWPGIWEQIFVPLAASFCIIVFGVKLHAVGKERGYMTVQDYLADRFESPRGLRGLSALSGIVVSLIYLVGQYTAISIVLVWLFGIPHWQALLISGIIITAYTVVGGLYAVSWTTLIQGGILIVGVLLMAPFVIASAGGLSHINTVLAGVDPNFVEPWFPSPAYASYAYATPEFLVSFGILLMVGLACAPHVINNVLAAKEARYFKWSPLIAFGIYAVVMFLVKFTGFAVRSLVEEGALALPDAVNAQDFAFIVGVEHAMPNVAFWALFAVIVLAAVMSTTDRLMLTIGTTFAWDIYKNILRPSAPDNEVLLVSKVAVVAAAGGTLWLAINPPPMLAWLIWMGIGVMLATFAVPLLAGLYWRGATREGAIASMGLGLAAATVFGYWHQFVAPLPVHFSFYALAISVLAMVVVSLMTASNSPATLDNTRTGWFIQSQ
ncbi:MAG TPA: sodium:solute symporter family protein [Candidatus Methanoculleus thermohydrogenotrophicum]|jgi:sodium/proline symporter|nr:sodium:solute symporter family protein [Candidatus Methanoculleus thermohydrogenotrophicum]HOB18631.1 sodium:solute symporter family protein [Candidatus Methanoculleus thermohydrogenotrophicum]HPZ38836.1 sodium:solute symporter family protein [Candidatus Methanoculleus thermohydrogenotrophicum]HQC91946.1 sodium:solute symporter family protein [Candidatus Methanoculleus thermohydrogenotrophicum]